MQTSSQNPRAVGSPRVHSLRRRAWFVCTVLLALRAMTCAPSRAAAQGLVERTIFHADSAITSLSLNDNGMAVWTYRPRDANGQLGQEHLWLWDGKKASDIGNANSDNSSARINDNNWVVWTAAREAGSDETDVYVRDTSGNRPRNISQNTDQGSFTTLNSALSLRPVLNNRNEVVWSGRYYGSGFDDLFYWKPGQDAAKDITFFESAAASAMPAINDQSRLTWIRTPSVDDPSTAVSDIVSDSLSDILQEDNPPSLTQLTRSGRDNTLLLNGSLNNSEQAVWLENDNGRYNVWEANAKGPRLLGDISKALVGDSRDLQGVDPAINDAGEVVWYMTSPSGQKMLYWYNGQSVAAFPLLFASDSVGPITLNNRGGFLYAAQNGDGYDLVFAQAAPEPGSFALTAALCCAALAARKRRQKPV